MSAADPHPELREKLDEMERQWATDREIDEPLIDEALQEAEQAPDPQIARGRVLLWAVLDELEFERLDDALRHGRELFDIARNAPTAELRKRFFIRSIRVERLLGEIPAEDASLLELAMSSLANALDLPKEVRASPALRAESMIERLRLQEVVGQGVDALAESRRLRPTLSTTRPGWLRGEFLADLACRELRAGNAHQAQEILAEHRAGQKTFGPPPKWAVAEAVGFFGLYARRPGTDRQISCQNAWGTVMAFLNMLQVGLENSRRYGLELISLGTVLRDVRTVLDELADNEHVVRVREFADQFEEDRTIRPMELSDLQSRLVTIGPFRFSGFEANREEAK